MASASYLKAPEKDASIPFSKRKKIEEGAVYICLNLQSTGLDPLEAHVIEIGAKVICEGPQEVEVDNPEFVSSVKTERPITSKAAKVNGRTNKELREEEEFLIVFKKFNKWLNSILKTTSLTPVIVGHYGNFVFQLLKAEMKRHFINTKLFKEHVKLSCSWEYFQKIQSLNPMSWPDDNKLETLHQHFCPENFEDGRRALEKAQMLEDILLHKSLASSSEPSS